MGTERLARVDVLADLRRQVRREPSLSKEDRQHYDAQIKKWGRRFKGLVDRQRIYLLMLSYRRIRSGKLEPGEERLARQEMKSLLVDLDELPTRDRGKTVPAGHRKRQIPRHAVARMDDAVANASATDDDDDQDGDGDGETD